ncbi:hypothetical protein FOA52_009797 [Chlamydomonas sp. UWO 241]|nr:hypothetical protein FOA52_009797 [Chlamydomonas sp. UWO 241]
METNGRPAALDTASMEAFDKEEDDLVFDELMDEDEEIDIVDKGEGQDAETNKFDRIVGCLEDILMDPDFEEAREEFCRSNCAQFEDNDENKLVYTDIFARYQELVESCIETRLTSEVPGFDMAEFMGMLESRKDELVMDVFELLLSMGDFASFKELMLSYQKEAEREAEGTGLRIECGAIHLHAEDQDDGEMRPDLDCGLLISPVGDPR